MDVQSSPGGKPLSSFWRFNIAVWLIFAVVDFVIRLAVMQNAGRAFWFTLVHEPIAFGISCLLYLIYRRPTLSDPFRLKTAVWMLSLSLLASIFQSTISKGFVEMTGWRMPGWTEREEWLFRFIFIWFIYLTWSLVFFAFKARAQVTREAERARQAAQEAEWTELQLLRAQLDPHFLFNALNGIAAEIGDRPQAALDMVHELSDYLRYSLENRHRVLAPLAWELDAVTAYLKIEQARFGDRMQASVEAEVEARQRQVPSFLLQPLVENAVKHGLREDFCDLHVWADCESAVLTIRVSNPGRLPENLEVTEGIGLETLRRRLAYHYPGRSHFELSQMDGIVTAELKLEGEPCSV